MAIKVPIPSHEKGGTAPALTPQSRKAGLGDFAAKGDIRNTRSTADISEDADTVTALRTGAKVLLTHHADRTNATRESMHYCFNSLNVPQ